MTMKFAAHKYSGGYYQEQQKILTEQAVVEKKVERKYLMYLFYLKQML